MRKIESHAELSEIISLGEGYILNDRPDRRLLHSTRCESLEVMSTKKYDKLFFDDLKEAEKWINKKYGVNGWEVCGRCQ